MLLFKKKASYFSHSGGGYVRLFLFCCSVKFVNIFFFPNHFLGGTLAVIKEFLCDIF